MVVDTNVALLANAATEKTSSWDPHCILACVTAIRALQAEGGLVLDDAQRILAEYFNKLSRSGMPGLGDAFAKWAWDHQGDARACSRVVITEHGDSFVEFPDHPDLASFDPSDRKFVAVAAAHGSAEVLQAVDSKWWGWREALAEAGVSVRFLCPEYIEATYQKKMEGRIELLPLPKHAAPGVGVRPAGSG